MRLRALALVTAAAALSSVALSATPAHAETLSTTTTSTTTTTAGPVAPPACAMCDAVTQVVTEALPPTPIDPATVPSLRPAVDAAATCVTTDASTCHQVYDAEVAAFAATDAVGDACTGAAGSDGVCATALQRLDAAMTAAQRLTGSCTGAALGVCSGSRSDLQLIVPVNVWQVCSSVVSTCSQLVNQELTFVLAEVAAAEKIALGATNDCLNNYWGTCQSTIRLADSLLSTVLVLTTNCLNDGLCKTAEGLVLGEVFTLEGQAFGFAGDCIGDYYGTCQSTERTAMAAANAAVALVGKQASQCLNDYYGTCQSSLRTAQALVNAAVAAGQQCASGANSTCATAKQLATGLANSALTLITTCANGSNATCNSAEQSAIGAVGSAVRLVSGGLWTVVGLVNDAPTAGEILSLLTAEEQQVLGLVDQVGTLDPKLIQQALATVVGTAQQVEAIVLGLGGAVPATVVGMVTGAVSGLQGDGIDIPAELPLPGAVLVGDITLPLQDAQFEGDDFAAAYALSDPALNLSTDPAATSSTQASGGCAPSGSGVKQFAPSTMTSDTKMGRMTWKAVPYTVAHAHFRTDKAQFTYEVIACMFGGSKARNGWRLLKSQISQEANPVNDSKTNYMFQPPAYETQDNVSTANASSAFQLTVGYGAVSVSFGTTATGQNKGNYYDPGPMGNMNTAYKASAVNTTNAWWQNYSPWYVPNNQRGSRDWQSSVLESSYEFLERDQSQFNFHAAAWAGMHCTVYASTTDAACPK